MSASAGLELWRSPERPGRDHDLEEEVLSKLRAKDLASDQHKTVSEALEHDQSRDEPKISIEYFLVCLLESQRDFAFMMRDIMDVLVLADSTWPEKSLVFEFKFGELTGSIRSTLEAFRATTDRVERLLASRMPRPNQSQLWRLTKRLRRSVSRKSEFPRSERVAPLRTFQGCSDAKLSALLRQALDLIQAHRNFVNELGGTRAGAFKAEVSGLAPRVQRDWRADWAVAATDYWDVETEYLIHDLAAESSETKNLNVIKRKLALHLSRVSTEEVWVERTFKELLDVLALPIWKKRHEMYSVWVGAIMLRTIASYDRGVRFHPRDNVLSFSFKGSHLASYTWDQKSFHVWCEMRTPLVGESAKRTKAVQPDYRVLQVDGSLGEKPVTRLVVECKHYLTASKSNFVQAAKDYARSCPEAKVVLVNHGATDEARFASSIDTELRARVRFVGSATATEERASSRVAEQVAGELFLALAATGHAYVGDEASLMPLASIHLIWSAPLQDMDLSIRALNKNGSLVKRVSYDAQGSAGSFPYARLREDVVSVRSEESSAEEVIDIYRWEFERYEIVATNYTGSPQIDPDNLRCVVKIDGAKDVVISPSGECDRSWAIASIVVRNQRLYVQVGNDDQRLPSQDQ